MWSAPQRFPWTFVWNPLESAYGLLLCNMYYGTNSVTVSSPGRQLSKVHCK